MNQENHRLCAEMHWMTSGHAFGWMARLRRLTVRDEERDDIYLAFTLLGWALAYANQIKLFCWAF